MKRKSKPPQPVRQKNSTQLFRLCNIFTLRCIHAIYVQINQKTRTIGLTFTYLFFWFRFCFLLSSSLFTKVPCTKHSIPSYKSKFCSTCEQIAGHSKTKEIQIKCLNAQKGRIRVKQTLWNVYGIWGTFTHTKKTMFKNNSVTLIRIEKLRSKPTHDTLNTLLAKHTQ